MVALATSESRGGIGVPLKDRGLAFKWFAHVEISGCNARKR